MFVFIQKLHHSPPSNVIVMTNEFQPENFFVIISWETVGYVDEYKIDINTTTQYINTTSEVLEGKYNIPLEINISAINCVGSSRVVSKDVNVGMLSVMYDVHTLPSVPLPLSWLFSSHSTCQW